MTLHVLVTERLSPGLRGVLSQWYVEVNPGTYVGTVSSRIRDNLWVQLHDWVLSNDLGYALGIHPAPNEQGYEMRTVGSSRYGVTDHHGLSLISEQHKARPISDEEDEIDPGW